VVWLPNTQLVTGRGMSPRVGKERLNGSAIISAPMDIYDNLLHFSSRNPSPVLTNNC
jgi:hypothetical protein